MKPVPAATTGWDHGQREIPPPRWVLVSQFVVPNVVVEAQSRVGFRLVSLQYFRRQPDFQDVSSLPRFGMGEDQFGITLRGIFFGPRDRDLPGDRL